MFQPRYKQFIHKLLNKLPEDSVVSVKIPHRFAEMKIRQGKIKVLRLRTLRTEDEIDYMRLLTTSWRASGGSMLES